MTNEETPITEMARQNLMERAWALVDPQREGRHWKDRVDSVVLEADLAVELLSVDDVVRAVAHFTATEARVTLTSSLGRPGYRIEADGYRAGPAGP